MYYANWDGTWVVVNLAREIRCDKAGEGRYDLAEPREDVR